MITAELTGAWDYQSLAPRIAIGRDCYIEGTHVFERCRGTKVPCVSIGNRVRVYTWTAFNVEPDGFVEVGDDSVLVGAVLMCAERISIGHGAVVSYHVTIADCDFHPHDPAERRLDAVANAPYGDRRGRPALESSPVVIGDGAWIGIGAIVLKGVTVGTGARVAPGAVVTSDVPAGATVAGNPARLVPTTAGTP